MERRATQHERLLWRHLRNRQFQGWKFRRQHPVDRYIIDFYCHEARPAIELDGGGNFANRESLDQERTPFLASKNILVLRFWDYLINRELRSVLETIWSTLK
jgi:very-short-patch-repair endonuclease